MGLHGRKGGIYIYKAGVQRHMMSGIHGRADVGAYSILLSGGYKDDVDNGKNMIYTGCGGRGEGHQSIGTKA